MEVPERHLVSTKTTVIGIAVSTLLCIISLKLVFGNIVPIYASLAAIILAMFSPYWESEH